MSMADKVFIGFVLIVLIVWQTVTWIKICSLEDKLDKLLKDKEEK